ncbi:ABC transporter permease subunit [Exiguobacterium sp. AM39-5BH]|uniref:ABC transporter permease subunit n=1 Tax=Exiguobacterium sp. AM39-5BH TaxID=2292355 RepID=UPI000FE1F6A8|nr:ABC transporter permease subunit [Exiguobacterium sp. AM39-5BH]RHB51918.1 ABC transporter permease subunit [Exiguobacterium sp. AM39-5BH]
MSRLIVAGLILFPFIGLFLAFPAAFSWDEAFGNTVLYVIILGLVNVWLGIGTAWWLMFTDSKWKTSVEWFTFLPLFIPVLASMFGMYIALAPLGLVGTHIGVGLVLLVTTLPYSIRLAYNAMYVVGRPLLEQTLTLAPWSRFGFVLFPLLKETIRTIVLFSTVIVLSQFVLVQLMGAGLIPTVTTRLYQAYAGNDVSLALQHTWVLVLVPVLLYLGLDGLFSMWIKLVKGRLR